jgi:hypothetical protein
MYMSHQPNLQEMQRIYMVKLPALPCTNVNTIELVKYFLFYSLEESGNLITIALEFDIKSLIQ